MIQNRQRRGTDAELAATNTTTANPSAPPWLNNYNRAYAEFIRHRLQCYNARQGFW